MTKEKKYISMELNKTNNMILRTCLQSDFRRQMEDATGKNGWIIGFIAENQNRDVFQKDIEEKFSMRRSTVSSMIQLMEKKGFITRTGVDYDARLKKLCLTPKAMELYREMMDSLKESDEKLREDISQEELSVFFQVLEKIRNNTKE